MTPDPADEYARDVIKKKYNVGREVRQMVDIHVDQMEHLQEYGFYWSTKDANKASLFFSKKLTLDSGEPFQLRPFQEFMVRRLYGLRHKVDDRRVIDTWYFEAGKAAGKSRLAAGICLLYTSPSPRD